MSAYKPKKITLLPESENANSFFARTLRWLTTAGRAVIICTEIVVIGAFLSRFYLDRKNSDLSEVIRQQKAIFEATKEFEKEFAVLQKQLDLIKNLKLQNPSFKDKIEMLTSSTPENITYQNLTLKYDTKIKAAKASLIVTSFQDSALVSFIQNLALNPNIAKVEVKQIDKKPKVADFSVSIDITFAPDKPQTANAK